MYLEIHITNQFVVEWWKTPAPAPYSWSEPSAWSSDKLYNWGDNQGDTNLLSDGTDWVDKYYRCQSIRLNGKAGAQFYNARYYNLYVSEVDATLVFHKARKNRH